jgi:glutathione S-transferase
VELIGMLDSPYVRRVAVSLQMLGLPFSHRNLSVFRDMDAFRQINPVIKAPTLVCDDGTVLMDSSLILQYAETLAYPRSLIPRERDLLCHDLRATGLALAACDKAVQIVYERGLRPPEKQHEPWIERVTAQMQGAFAALEAEMRQFPFPSHGEDLTQAGVMSAVAWHFTRAMLPELLSPAGHPLLQALSLQAEQRPAFRAAPHGDGSVSRP